MGIQVDRGPTVGIDAYPTRRFKDEADASALVLHFPDLWTGHLTWGGESHHKAVSLPLAG